MKDVRMHSEFFRGAWFAWDEVLGWINTQTEQKIDKADLYKHVMQLRPRSLHEWLVEQDVKLGDRL